MERTFISFITIDLDNTNSFDYKLSIDLGSSYKISYVTVKTVDFFDDGNNDNVYVIRSSLVGSKVLSYFKESRGQNSSLQNFKQPLFGFSDNNTYNFQICDVSGNLVNTSGNLIIVLEFN